MVTYSIDKESDTPLYIQIRDVILEAIRLGELHPGDRLPSVSSLAKEIGVTQATVRRALQDLSDAGQACCHVGRGTFIQEAKASQDEFVDGAPAFLRAFEDRQRRQVANQPDQGLRRLGR